MNVHMTTMFLTLILLTGRLVKGKKSFNNDGNVLVMPQISGIEGFSKVDVLHHMDGIAVFTVRKKVISTTKDANVEKAEAEANTIELPDILVFKTAYELAASNLKGTLSTMTTIQALKNENSVYKYLTKNRAKNPLPESLFLDGESKQSSQVPDWLLEVPRDAKIYFYEKAAPFDDAEMCKTLAMELVGTSIFKSFVKNKQNGLNLKTKLSMLLQMLIKLRDYRHIKVRHSDIKPENIVIDNTDPNRRRIMFIDYGSAWTPSTSARNLNMLNPTLTHISFDYYKSYKYAMETGNNPREPSYNDDLEMMLITFYEVITGKPHVDSKDFGTLEAAKENFKTQIATSVPQLGISETDKEDYRVLSEIMVYMLKDARSGNYEFHKIDEYIKRVYTLFDKVDGSVDLTQL